MESKQLNLNAYLLAAMASVSASCAEELDFGSPAAEGAAQEEQRMAEVGMEPSPQAPGADGACGSECDDGKPRPTERCGTDSQCAVRTAFGVQFELKACTREGEATLSCEFILSSLDGEQFVFLPTVGDTFNCRPWTKSTSIIDEFGSEYVARSLQVGDDIYGRCGRVQPLVQGFETSATFLFPDFSRRAERLQRLEFLPMVGVSTGDLQAAEFTFTAIDITSAGPPAGQADAG